MISQPWLGLTGSGRHMLSTLADDTSTICGRVQGSIRVLPRNMQNFENMHSCMASRNTQAFQTHVGSIQERIQVACAPASLQSLYFWQMPIFHI